MITTKKELRTETIKCGKCQRQRGEEHFGIIEETYTQHEIGLLIKKKGTCKECQEVKE